MIVDPRRNRFAMNMQLRQRFTRANPNRLKISQKSQIFLAFFYSQKNPKVLKTSQKHLASKKPNWQPCYTRIENAHKVRKKTFNICYV